MFEGLLQPVHVLIILAIALLVFGPSRLPELGKGLGKSLRDFKDTMDGAGDKLMKEVGVSAEDAKKVTDSLQAMRGPNLQKTLAAKALEHTGLGDLTAGPTAAAAAPSPDAAAPALEATAPAAEPHTPAVSAAPAAAAPASPGGEGGKL
ncbi:MAG: twin-arginine translocase TatA/TatE family subunit [Acidobacteriota bacterium]|nr:twin-arginine translocase TatA/TatE family subunit [Acidobacteriota bacterium]